MAHLAAACRSNDCNKALAALFKEPALVNQVDFRSGRAPLHVCAEHNSVDVAKVLLEKKADIDVGARGTTFADWTPLHFAYEHNQQVRGCHAHNAPCRDNLSLTAACCASLL